MTRETMESTNGGEGNCEVETKGADDKKDEEETPEKEYDKIQVEEAIKDKLYIKGKLNKWIEERGFGFAMTRGQEVFVHRSAIRGGQSLAVGSSVILKILADPS